MSYKDVEKQRAYNKKWSDENKEYFKIYRANNLKQLTVNSIKWKVKFPERSILVRTKCRAKKHNIDFNIEESDIVIPTTCPVLGIPINITDGSTSIRGPKPNSVSIDRIDNTKGYIKGNIRIMSHQANIMKSSASPEELLQFAFWVILHYGHLIKENKQHVD
jgi:hypothetical protein